MSLVARLCHDAQLLQSGLQQLFHTDTKVLLRVRGASDLEDGLG
jgi:hypothetical protein